MAVNTIMIKIDTVEKDTWDAILALANESDSIAALAEAGETLLALVEDADALSALAEKSEELLALVESDATGDK